MSGVDCQAGLAPLRAACLSFMRITAALIATRLKATTLARRHGKSNGGYTLN